MTTNSDSAAAASAATSATATATAADAIEERLVDAEYKIWKKNTPYLYDFVLTHSLEWPSLTCQWLPQTRSGPHAVEHNLLLGTHTTGEQNYLMVASCSLPKDETVEEQGIDGGGAGVAGSGSNVTEAAEDDEANRKPPAASSSAGGTSRASTTAAASAALKSAPQYDEERKEVGGFGHAHSAVGKIEIKMKVQHEGEVNRARYMPQNHFVVASRGPSSEIYIFDLSKHPSFPSETSTFCPQGVCIGHDKEGYSMAWSPHDEGMLLTGSEDRTVKLWDVRPALAPKASAGTQISATSTFCGHSDIVEDVAWHAKDRHMMGSVGDDRQICLWDTRKPDAPAYHVANAHDEDINCIAFNPFNEFVFATGSADKTVAIWDMRNLSQRASTLQGHTDQVYMVQWAPFNESILASCSPDRRVAVWDLSRIGQEQSAEDAEDGPPELLFLHGGHTAKVSDFGWNAKSEWTIASVAEDNVLQVWCMAEEIYAEDDDGDDDDDDEGDAGKGGVLGDDELE